MSIKIDAPRRYMSDGCAYANKVNAPGATGAVRLVDEKDWRKLMKLVRAVEAFDESPVVMFKDELWAALDALKGRRK